MQIRKCKAHDLDTVMNIYKKAQEFMIKTGNLNQWPVGYPPQSAVEEDIQRGVSYVCVDENDKIQCVFYFNVQEEVTYKRIYDGQWLNDAPYGVIHRIASREGAKGMAALCFDWCMEQCGNIRIDTHRDNAVMQKALEKSGFQKCGVIFLENGDERIAFQKTAL